MILIACIDDKGGMMFNRRRQSQDRVLRRYILEMAAGSRLWMNAYTFGQFKQENIQEAAPSIQVAEDFPGRAGAGEYCLCENTDFHLWEGRVEQVILFRWNRTYPADLYFRQVFSLNGWHCTQSEEFPGYSHEKITKEVYER